MQRIAPARKVQLSQNIKMVSLTTRGKKRCDVAYFLVMVRLVAILTFPNSF